VSMPESALDDPDEAMFWAEKSMVPAQKAATKRTKAKQARK